MKVEKKGLFFPIWVSGKEKKLVLADSREKKRQHYHVMDIYKQIMKTLELQKKE